MNLKDYYVAMRKKSGVTLGKHVLAQSEEAAIHLAKKNSPTLKALFARPTMVSTEEWECIPEDLRIMLNTYRKERLTGIFDDELYRKLTKWQPPPYFDGLNSRHEMKKFIKGIGRMSDLDAHEYITGGDSYMAVYVSSPAGVTIRVIDDEKIQHDHLSLIIFFSNFSPIAAMGIGVWSEIFTPDGTTIQKSYETLNSEMTVSLSSLPPCAEITSLIAALAKTPYVIAEPMYLKKSAPNWFSSTVIDGKNHQRGNLFDVLYQSFFDTSVCSPPFSV
jgi:hypothetical protein